MTNLCLEDEHDGEEDEEHEEVYAEDYDDTEAPPLPPFMKPVPPPTSAPAFVDRTKHIVSNALLGVLGLFLLNTVSVGIFFLFIEKDRKLLAHCDECCVKC
jgi:hypothetical protein